MPSHPAPSCKPPGSRHDQSETKPSKSESLSLFESKTIRLGIYGLFVAVFSLCAACVAAYLVFQQFKEMAAQTELLNRAARQARIDSAQSEITTTRQIATLAKQASAAEGSVAAIQQQTFQQERPWVGIEVKPPPDFEVTMWGSSSIDMAFTLSNIGHSVARHVTVVAALVPGDGWKAAEDRACKAARINDREPSVADAGYVLFPNEQISHIALASFTPADIQRALAHSPYQNANIVTSSVAICVDYETSFDSLHHQTRQAFELTHTRGGGLVNSAFELEVKYDQIYLSPILAGDSAD